MALIRSSLLAAIVDVLATSTYRILRTAFAGLQRCAGSDWPFGIVGDIANRKIPSTRRWNAHFGVMCRLGPLVIFMEQPLVPRQARIDPWEANSEARVVLR